VAWIVRLVSLGAEGEERSTDVLRIARSDDLTDLASLGLTLAESKQLLAGVQQEIVAAQARVHAAHRPECRNCGTPYRMKDYRRHGIATLFGQVTVRLPRFRCAGCETFATGVDWPPHVRSTPELDRLRAQLSALLTYRTAADLLAQMFPVDAGAAHETLRRHTFKIAEELPMPAPLKPATPVEAITVTLDATFIRSCEAGERHLEVRIGNVETAAGGRQVFGPPAYGSLRHRFAVRRLRGGGGWTRRPGWARARRSAPHTLAGAGPRPRGGGGSRRGGSGKRWSACCGARTSSWCPAGWG